MGLVFLLLLLIFTCLFSLLLQIIQPALNVLINLVCPPPSLSNKPPLAQNHQPVSGQATARPSTDAAADTQSTGNAPPTPVAPASSGLVGDRRIFLGAGTGSAGLAAKLEQVYRLAREAVRGNDGIKILLKLLQPRIYVNPPAAPDCLRALACRVLLGLARDETIAQILTKLEVEYSKFLSPVIFVLSFFCFCTDFPNMVSRLVRVCQN